MSFFYLYCIDNIFNNGYYINRLLVIFYFIAAIVFLYTKFVLYDNIQLLAFYEDDFFYYLETAKNFLLFGFPSIDLKTPTNGYHPLWFLIITFIQIPSRNPYYISLVVTTFSFISLFITFLYSQRIFFYFSNNKKISNYFSIICTSLFLIYYDQGMEIILVFPLIAILIFYLISNENSALKYGLLFNILFLARLDTIFLLFLVFVSFAIYKHQILKNKYFYFPFIISLIYLISNIIIFDSLLPVSGLAKQLKTSYTPVYSTIQTIFYFQRDRIIYGFIPFIFFIVNFILVYRVPNRKFKILFLLINTFPFIFSFYNSIFSGWYYWSWYYYIFFPSILVFFILILQYESIINVIKKLLPFSTILIILFYFHISRNIEISKTLFYENALEVVEFEKQHQGIYAMGDRAGLISYLIDSPVVHLEGLVMDKKFVSELQSTPKLMDLLKKYNVDYYIANNAKKIESGYLVEEPYRIHEYQITSTDTLDIVPFIIEDNKGWKFQIFDLKKK